MTVIVMCYATGLWGVMILTSGVLSKGMCPKLQPQWMELYIAKMRNVDM